MGQRRGMESRAVPKEPRRDAVSGFRSASPGSDSRVNAGRNRRFRASRKTGERRAAKTTAWVRRLLVASLVAASHGTGTAPEGRRSRGGSSASSSNSFRVCRAFVLPATRTDRSTRPGRGATRGIPKAPRAFAPGGEPKVGSGGSAEKISAEPGTSLFSNLPRGGNGDGMGAAGRTYASTNKNINNTNKNKNNITTNRANQTNNEVAGFVLAVGIILSLAGMSGTGGDVVGNGTMDVTSSSVAVVTKVVENTVPTTSTEVVAVTLGESIGGVIGAVFSVAINFVLRGGRNRDDRSESPGAGASIDRGKQQLSRSSLLSQGLSDGDFFIANSASYSFLEAMGVPESVAKYGSIFIAAIPSQLVKIGSSLSEQRREKEDELLRRLLREEQERAERKKKNPSAFFSSPPRKPGEATRARVVNPKELVPLAVTGGAAALSAESATSASIFVIDFVEVFADVTRWLEYDVLKSEYGEVASSLLWMGNNHAPINSLQSAITYSLLGALAAVSSRWYADILYGRFGYGPVGKQREVRSRNDAEWFSLYSSTAASAAALFGCYEFFQLPIGRYIQGTLSGGVEGCVGSSRFNACLQTFIDTNSPGPTPEAQLRALITNLYAVWIRLQDIAGDTTWDDVAVLVRAWSVSFASYIANLQ